MSVAPDSAFRTFAFVKVYGPRAANQGLRVVALDRMMSDGMRCLIHLILFVAAGLSAAVADAAHALRNSPDTRTAYHVNGSQFIDERAATYSDASGQFRYYLLGDNFSIAGYGNAAGGVTRVRSGSNGDFVCDPPPPPCNGCGHAPTCPGDVDGDESVGPADLALFLGAFGSTLGDPTYDGCADFDCDGAVGLADMGELLGAFGEPCPPCTPDITTGAFVLHGRPVDVLADGKTLVYLRARFYDPQNGRWLQRDPSGYVDGGNLYESFRGNATAHTDPSGEEVWVEAQRRRETGPAGQDVWAVDYTINESGVGLGLGGQLFLFYNYWFGSIPNSEIVERIPAGTEQFSYTEDWKQIKRMDALVESQRLILEQGYIANRDVGNLRQGIIVLGTTAVALPAAHMAAPLAQATFGTTIAGSAATGAATGSLSFASGTAASHWIVGDSTEQILTATRDAAGQGAVFGGILGAAGRFDIRLTGPQRFQFVQPFNWGSTARVTQFYDPSKGSFGPGARTALASEPAPAWSAQRFFDGPWFGRATAQTWVSPYRAAEQGWITRGLTGRGSLRNYVEFDVARSELGLPGGAKTFLLAPYQRVLTAPIELTGRNAIFGTLSNRVPYMGQIPSFYGGAAGMQSLGSRLDYWERDAP